MLGKIFSLLVILSFIAAIITGNMANVNEASITEAVKAVTFSVELMGIMALWCGIMEVFEKAGLMKKLSKLISPLIKLLFPAAYKNKKGISEISANISANLLGLGNAATPMGMQAMEKLKDPESKKASNDMVMLVVLNTASIQIIPTTLISLRALNGSQAPGEILVPVWICSIITCTFAVIITKILQRLFK